MINKPDWRVHAFYIVLMIFAVLQIGYQRDALGYHTARSEECGKMVNSDNYAYANKHMLPPLTHDERWEMKDRCEALADADFKREQVWFWKAPEREYGKHYNQLWHY